MDKTMLKRWAVVIGVVMVNVIVHAGIAGLAARGIYMLNSFFGWAANAKPWQYGIVGLVYLGIQTPLVYMQISEKLRSYLRWGFLF